VPTVVGQSQSITQEVAKVVAIWSIEGALLIGIVSILILAWSRDACLQVPDDRVDPAWQLDKQAGGLALNQRGGAVCRSGQSQPAESGGHRVGIADLCADGDNGGRQAAFRKFPSHQIQEAVADILISP
jgi:hypothetical protein